MPPDYFTRRYGSTFYIFPAFLPLVELLPWFLTMLGGTGWRCADGQQGDGET